MDEMSGIDQSKDSAEAKAGVSRPDFFTKLAGNHLSRRDMVKASVVAGGLVWSAPMLLSSNTASAQVTCCPAGSSPVTVTIDPAGNIGCGTLTCLGGAACDPDILTCIGNFVTASVVTSNALVTIIQIILVPAGGASIGAVAVNTTGDGCTVVGNCPVAGAGAPPLIVIAANSVTVAVNRVQNGDLIGIELELCVPGAASGLCP